jgi:glycosyltransferase involved in cell wall biosynthesis
MKICLITPYFKPIKGGISNYVLQMSKTLKEKEQKVYIITRQGKKDIETDYVINVNKFFFIIKTFLRIWNLKPDILHSHSHWYTLAPCIIYKYLKPRTVVVHTFHTDPVENPNKIKRVSLAFLFSKCNAVTFVSKYLQERITTSIDIRTKKGVIYGGTNPNTIRDKDINEFKKKYNLQEHCQIICFIGVLSWKLKAEGAKILVKSFNQITKELPDLRLIIVGDGVYRKEVEKIAEDLEIDSKIIFTGFVDNPLIPLNLCDIYTHISLQEGFPLSVLEAMSCEKAIIASSTGGIPEVINDGENGLLVEPSPEAISKAIVNLINSPEKRSKLGNNAKKDIEEKFTWSKIVEDFIDIYLEK